MTHTVEAIIDESGHVHLAQPLRLSAARRALVTVLEEPPSEALETTLLTEQSLAKDWSRPQEDDAWSHLQ